MQRKSNLIFYLLFFALCITTMSCKKEQLSDANFNPSKDIYYTFADTLSNLTVTFSDDSKGAAKYFWDFGDGATSTQANPTHTYADSGKIKRYTITRVATGPAGYRDTVRNVIAIYSAIPQIKLQNTSGVSGNGKYRIWFPNYAYYQFAKKMDFYLITNGGTPTLQKTVDLSQNAYQNGSSDYYAPFDIGNFDATTVNQNYKLKIVATGSAGKTKDVTVDIVPQITRARLLSAQLWNMPTGWAVGAKIDLAITSDQLYTGDPNNIRQGYTSVQNCMPWNLNGFISNGNLNSFFRLRRINASGIVDDQKDFFNINILVSLLPPTAKLFDKVDKTFQGISLNGSLDANAQLKIFYQYE